MVLLAGCADDPRVDADGIAAYACALAEDLVEGVSAAEWDLVPAHDADESVVVATAVVALLGGLSSTPLPGHGDLYAAAGEIWAAMEGRDVPRIDGGLAGLVAACDGSGADGGVDTSRGGRVEYACALVSDAADQDRAADPWAAGPEARTAGTFFHATYGAAALLGGPLAARLPGHEELSEASQDLYTGLTRMELSMVWDAVDSIHSTCVDA